MPDKIVQLTAGDFEDTMDFISVVFGSQGTSDFQALLPKLYKPEDAYMRWNTAIKRHGKIRAMVGLYPLQLNVGEGVLEGRGIGAVSVHPNDRGQGHMNRLMEHLLDLMQSEGVHFSWLGGQRQRYGYFGYEVCGTMLAFYVSKASVRHAFKATSEISLHPVERSDQSWLRQIKHWHDQFPIHATRPLELLWEVLRSWKNQAFIATDPSGEAVGYLCADVKGGIVHELGGNEAYLRSIIAAWVNFQHGSCVEFQVPAIPGKQVSELIQLSERTGLQANYNWQILDWPPFLDALLKLKAGTTQLPDGAFCLDIKNAGRILLEVQNGNAGCARSDRLADYACDSHAAHRLLFGPLKPEFQGVDDPWLNRLCPLPIFMPAPDRV